MPAEGPKCKGPGSLYLLWKPRNQEKLQEKRQRSISIVVYPHHPRQQFSQLDERIQSRPQCSQFPCLASPLRLNCSHQSIELGGVIFGLKYIRRDGKAPACGVRTPAAGPCGFLTGWCLKPPPAPSPAARAPAYLSWEPCCQQWLHSEHGMCSVRQGALLTRATLATWSLAASSHLLVVARTPIGDQTQACQWIVKQIGGVDCPREDANRILDAHMH